MFPLDIQVHPDFNGLPPSVKDGLIHLTNNAAALLTLVSALGIVASILLMVVASWPGTRALPERGKGGLVLAIAADARLHGGRTGAL